MHESRDVVQRPPQDLRDARVGIAVASLAVLSQQEQLRDAVLVGPQALQHAMPDLYIANRCSPCRSVLGLLIVLVLSLLVVIVVVVVLVI